MEAGIVEGKRNVNISDRKLDIAKNRRHQTVNKRRREASDGTVRRRRGGRGSRGPLRIPAAAAAIARGATNGTRALSGAVSLEGCELHLLHGRAAALLFIGAEWAVPEGGEDDVDPFHLNAYRLRLKRRPRQRNAQPPDDAAHHRERHQQRGKLSARRAPHIPLCACAPHEERQLIENVLLQLDALERHLSCPQRHAQLLLWEVAEELAEVLGDDGRQLTFEHCDKGKKSGNKMLIMMSKERKVKELKRPSTLLHLIPTLPVSKFVCQKMRPLFGTVSVVVWLLC